jgi:hypothetical protein
LSSAGLRILQNRIQKTILPYFGAMEIGKINYSQLGNFVQKLSAQGLTPTTIRGCKNFCVNGQLAGNCCTPMEMQNNDRHERIDRQPAG